MNDLLDAALAYARQDLRVLPLHTPRGGRCSCRKADCRDVGKHPRTEHGLDDATTDEGQITRWWTRWPDANIGIRTGRGIAVLDVDPRHGGDESLRNLEQENDKLPVTVTTITGSGGEHRWFAVNGHAANSSGKLASGLDTKGDGGYVVAPPSLHVSGRRYEWEAGYAFGEVPLAPWPDWLTPPKAGRNGRAPDIDGQIPEGARNPTLTSLAGTLVHRGLPPAVVLANLLATNAQLCDPALPDDEVRRIAASVERYRENGWEPPLDEDEDEDDEDEGTAAGREGDPLAWLRARRRVFRGLLVQGARKTGRRGGRFELVFEGYPPVDLGSAADLLSPQKVQAAIFDVTEKAIVEMSRPKWRRYAEAIGALAGQGDDLGLEPEVEARAWLSALSMALPGGPVDLSDKPALADRLRYMRGGEENQDLYFEDRMARRAGFWTTRGEMVVNVPGFVRFITSPAYGARTGHADARLRLGKLGFKPAPGKDGQISARHEDGKIEKLRAFISPPNFDPDD
jgi:hypothetical protein